MQSEASIIEFRNMAVAAIASRIGVWHYELASPEDLKRLVSAKSPELLAAIDGYYELLRRCEVEEQPMPLIPERDAARERMVALVAENSV